MSMWWNDRTLQVMIEDRIHQFSREVEQERLARQATAHQGPDGSTFVTLMNKMSRLVLGRSILPLSTPVRHR
jgi:hypothetical protein